MAGPRNPSTTPQKNNPCKLIAIICLALIVIVGLAILITWLAIKPKNLQYSIVEGYIRDYNLTNDGQFKSTFYFGIWTFNPNHKASIYYDKMDVIVTYRGQDVASGSIAPFFQPKRNVTTLEFQNSAKDVTLSSDQVKHLKNERNGGQVDLDIKINARMRVKVGIWKSRHYKVKILCSPVVINFSNDKRFQKTNCDVDI
ncbi:uncharacterized protein At1g08160-like [Amaranthus tricolor]|uniref:uncharacterized protein At1g08160-like n=1 Tax=Amaranthus tricolor TaxID=29722 RepID=UPI00258D3238|nr:uncharacterized protein At1g08160-like [Amaranthus tricolor]